MNAPTNRMTISNAEEPLSVRHTFDARQVSDDCLRRLRKLAVHQLTDMSPRFGEWVRAWCEAEQFARKKHPDERTQTQLVALPELFDWTDKELAGVVRAIGPLTLIHWEASLSDFLDRLTLYVGVEAADRLEKHEPPPILPCLKKQVERDYKMDRMVT
jgi:hypothetical protein